ncbi:hypothetical protein [Vibrio sp. WXL103]|uniref:hypothetical protein n=1 Tax=unclassified Vibrio TaxID=2614977 RepID=UPI003EC51014
MKKLFSRTLFNRAAYFAVLLGLSPLSTSFALSASEQFAIISLNPEFEQLSVSKAKKLYRGKTKKLQGERIELSDWPEGTNVREEFYKSLLGKTVAQMNAHWASLSFSGKARPPKEIDGNNVNQLIEWLNDDPSRIGYAPLRLVPENANIIYVVGAEK